MATSTEAEAPKDKPKKGKGMLIMIVLAVVLAAGAGGGVWYYMKMKSAGHDEEEVAKPEPKHPPAYLALENMVVNLADPGGERFAQLGITVEMADEKAADKVKPYMPSIRSAVLMLVSQRTSEELLKREGKVRLANDIAVEVARPLGFADEMREKIKAETPAAPAAPAASGASAEGKSADAKDDDEAPKPKKRKKAAKEAESENPVHGVLFSSFIIQ